MSGVSPLPRVQFVVSGKFLILLLIAGALLGGGYYWYTQQQEPQKRFRTPPYFVNRGPAVFRLCQHCLGLDRLTPKTEWGVGAPAEIPATEQRWFLAVEDPPLPVEISGVLMLPVYPAQGDNPALGFDRTRVWLVLFQSLQRMPELTQLPRQVLRPWIYRHNHHTWGTGKTKIPKPAASRGFRLLPARASWWSMPGANAFPMIVIGVKLSPP